ncbi:MAG TPA: hypothetical protein VKM55_11110 [Candidatus Lokiarchaeia archaeon]|nr:hypothetical protein [Candidatus Lokiarchaeia archaeon]
MSNGTSSKNDIHKYVNLEKGGLDYVKREKNYLKLSIIYPIFSLFVQLLNLLLLPYNGILSSDHRPDQFFFFDMFSPASILLVISSFFLAKAIFLIHWKRKVENYEKLSAKFSNESISIDKDVQDSPAGSNSSLTKIFYDIVRNMEVIRKIFIIVNAFFCYYVIWFIQFTFIRGQFGGAPPMPPPSDSENFSIIQVLNYLNVVVMIFYLVYEWKHFYRWNKKLTKLRDFEKKISKELDL